jgi:chemotaxis signal transduction protein
MSQFVLVLFASGRKWGLVVDSVDGVRTLEVRLSRGDGTRSTSINRGLVSDTNLTAVLLDPEAVVGSLGLSLDLLDAAVPG